MLRKRPTLMTTAAAAVAGAAIAQSITRRTVAREAGSVKSDDNKPSADELDKDLLEQLHAATLKASDSCFEIKKLCATVLVPTGTLVALFSNRRLSPAVFVSGFLVITFFWLADAVGYYYQRKLRVAMGVIWVRRSERCDETWIPPSAASVSPFKAVFNGSMYFYLLLAILVLVGLALYAMGIIESAHKVGP